MALAAAFLLTALLTLPWVPVANDLRIELLPAGGATIPVSAEDLTRKIVELGISESAHVILFDGARRIELSGVTPPVDDRVLDLLVESGYQRREVVPHPTIDFAKLLRTERGALPALLSVQAAAFLVLGWLLARWRVRAVEPGAAASAGRALGFGILGGLAALALSAVLAWLLQAVGLPVEEQDWLAELYGNPSAMARLVPWLVLLGPLSEEVFFRGYAFRYITQEAGVTAGLLVSSVLFAAIHFNVSGFLLYLTIGCILAWVHHRTNHLLAPVAGHVVVNAVVLFASGLSGGPQVGP